MQETQSDTILSEPNNDSSVGLPLGAAQARRRFARATLALIALGVALFCTWPVFAALQLEYFNAIASPSAVLLEWSTLSEYNLAGFQIECKEATAPESDYHLIGTRQAKGSQTQGAQYDFLVDRGLTPGTAYCFKLVETTTDGAPGDIFERCGYGLGITPTPRPPGGAPAVLTPLPGEIPGPDAYLTLTPAAQQPQSPLQPTSPLPTVESPLATPTQLVDMTNPQVAAANALANEPLPTDPALAVVQQEFIPTPNPLDSGQVVASGFDPNATPTLDPYAAVGQLPTDIPYPTEIPTEPPSQETLLAQNAAQPPAPDGNAAQALALAPTPTSIYVVVTAVPTLPPVALAPVLTPWPTATPAPRFELTNLFAPTAQNLTVMLLCFIFFSASGLGILGLVTSVLYMRSRNQREMTDIRSRYRSRY